MKKSSINTQNLLVFLLSIASLFSLFMVPNNKILFLLVCLSVIGFYRITKNLKSSLLYSYILFLPFEKGKGIEYLLIRPENLYPHVPFSVSVNFTMSSFLLACLMFLYIRERFTKKKIQSVYTLQLGDIFLFLFLVSNFVSSFFSPIPPLSFGMALVMAGFIFLYFFIRESDIDKRHLTSIFTTIISAQFIFEGIWSILQFINKGPLGKAIEDVTNTGVPFLASEDSSLIRIQGTFSHPNFLGIFITTLAPILIVHFFSRRSYYSERLITGLSLLLGTLALILSASRTSWIAMVIFSLLAYRSIPKIDVFHLGKHKKILIRLSFLICIFLFPAIIWPRLSQFAQITKNNSSADYRWYFIEKTLTIVTQNPLGVGLGTFPMVLYQSLGKTDFYPAQPHNLFAQILAVSGWIGLCSFLFFLRLRKNLWLLRNQFVLASLSFLFLAQFYPVLTEQTLIGYFWLLIALTQHNEKTVQYPS